MIEVLQVLGPAETFLRRGDNNLQLRCLFLFNTLGSVKKQKEKEIVTVLGMVLYLCLSRK